MVAVAKRGGSPTGMQPASARSSTVTAYGWTPRSLRIDDDARAVMARLVYASNMSFDGCTEDERGAFHWSPPDDEVFLFINGLMPSARTYLYGRRMYGTMAVWETDSSLAGSRNSRPTTRARGRRRNRRRLTIAGGSRRQAIVPVGSRLGLGGVPAPSSYGCRRRTPRSSTSLEGVVEPISAHTTFPSP